MIFEDRDTHVCKSLRGNFSLVYRTVSVYLVLQTQASIESLSSILNPVVFQIAMKLTP